MLVLWSHGICGCWVAGSLLGLGGFRGWIEVELSGLGTKLVSLLRGLGRGLGFPFLEDFILVYWGGC